jgi:hypothetical protein
MLILAGANAWMFHRGVWVSVPHWDLDRPTPMAARIAGGASLVLWTAMIFAGRLIAYNWFDCENVQSSVIAWFTGC